MLRVRLLGELALEISGDSVAVVLMDIQMPDVDGLQATPRITGEAELRSAS